MEYAVEAANELLNLPVLPDSGKIVSIPRNDIVLEHVTFSYDGSEQNEVLHMWKAHIGAKNWSVSEKKEVAAHV